MYFRDHFRKKKCQMVIKSQGKSLLSYKLCTRLIAYQEINYRCSFFLKKLFNRLKITLNS